MTNIKKLKTPDYDCNYCFRDGKKIFIFLNGTIGVKEFFFEFKKYKKKNDGYLFIDLPGFGSSNLKKNTNKNITKIQVEAIYKIILKEKIRNIVLIIFSLSTVYLPMMEKISFFKKNINKIIFIDPSLFLNDLVWSKKINSMNKKEYFTYINFYKKNINFIFHSSLLTNKNYNNICKNLKMFDNLVLYKFNKECIKILKSKKVLSSFKKTIKYFIFPKLKKNLKKLKKATNVFLIGKSGHYVFLDQPKKTYSLINKYAE